MRLQVYRNGEELTDFEIDDKTIFKQKLMGEHKVTADVIVKAPLRLNLGDYITHGAERFYINTPPEVEKINNFTYRYIIEFEGEIYRLYNKRFMDEGAVDFSYHGTPEEFLLLLLTNMNSIDAGWSIEEVEPAASQTLSFNNSSCRNALTAIAEAFNLEYRLVNKNIYMQRSVGADTTLSFRYGRGQGLYHLNRNKIEDRNVVTRVFGFGARKNISHDYRDGAKRLIFDAGYLEKNTELYGVREGSVTFDDIFPNRTGTVTEVYEEEPKVIADNALNFDINQQLIEGVTAKIVFKSGALSGYEFEIQSYRHGSRQIQFIPFVEENGYTLPNSLNYPQVGDEYTLVDIKMPQIYIDEAEAKLQERTKTYLEENSTPRVTYLLSIDEKYVRERGIELRCADLVKIEDENLGIDNKIRVAEVSYPLVNQDQVTALIADTIPYTIQERVIADTVDNNTEIRNVDRSRQELARRASIRFRELQNLITDPDGYFDPSNIKPGSIETLMLSVGARSQDFGLIDVTIQANAQGNPNTLDISGGQLAHYQIEIEGLGYVWDMDPRVFTDLDPEKHYYVYARCSATSLTGTWEISQEPVRTDQEPGFYAFNLGVLYSVNEGRRDFDFTNGMTYINGDTITTGRIKSLDGLNFFDLDDGSFKLGNDESSLDYNVTEEGRLTLKGVLVSSFIIADGATIENLSVRNLRTRDEGRRLEISESGNNLILYDSRSREVVRLDDDIDTNQLGDSLGGLRATNPANGRVAYASGNGLFSNGSGTRFFSATTGTQTRASVVGLLAKSGPGINAAVAGINQTRDEKAIGGYFYGGLRIDGPGGLDLQSGLKISIQKVNNSDHNAVISSQTVYVVAYNTRDIYLHLPLNPSLGRTIYARRMNAGLSVYGNVNRMVRDNVVQGVGINKGDVWMFVWDGSYWLCNYMGRSS